MKLNDKSFLYFEDITEKYDDPIGWITVARFDEYNERDYRSLFSALAPNTQPTRAYLLSKSDWDVHADFGHPYFEHSNFDGLNKIDLSLGDRISINDSVIESFMIHRSFHDLFPDTFEPVQNFILYHNLVRDDTSGSYIEPISTDIVIQYPDPEHVQIRIRYLKDYLAARKMLLVRFHDHYRQDIRSITEIIGKEHDTLKINNDLKLYTININAYEKKTNSRLVGKDIITPYDEPLHHDYLFLTKKHVKYVNFIWDLDDDGNQVEASCTTKQAPNEFLRPIYFKKTVLQKYYDNPRLYQVYDGQLSHLVLWGIPYGQNEHDLVIVWLGDLGKLPYEEQLHWKQHNIAPEGSIGRVFRDRQLRAKATKSDDPVHIIIHLRKQINKKFQELFNFPLFRPLLEDDYYVLDTLHSLITNEQKEFDEQILYLTKGFIDSLDKKSLKSKTKWIPETNACDTTLTYFEHFLNENTNLNSDDILKLIKIFKMIQNLRSLSTAHIKSNKYNKYLRKMNLDKNEPQKRFLNIVHIFSVQLKILLSIPTNDQH